MSELLQRNLPGTTRQNFYGWQETRGWDEVESSFALQQFLQLQLRSPPTAQVLDLILKRPEDFDENLWQYEHLRRVCQDLNLFLTKLQYVCKPTECNEMKADEWLYLCAAHATPQNCSAIDYMIHTLDGATALLNSQKFFPSRVSVTPAASKHFQSIARRLYRIFAHAFFHHRKTFDEIEAQTLLYRRFVRLSNDFQWIPPKLMVIPETSVSQS